MIATILIVGLAFAWLLLETNWLRVRLPVSGNGGNIEALQSNSEAVAPAVNGIVFRDTIPKTQPDALPFEPSRFTSLDMPDTIGTLNILCERK